MRTSQSKMRKLNNYSRQQHTAPNDRLREPWNFYVMKDEAKQRYEKLAEEYLQQRFPTKPNLVESSLKVVTSTPVSLL